MSLRAVELFAGVGGFHLGLQNAGIEVVWANQWEPGRKVQHAFDCYMKNFEGANATNVDIGLVKSTDIPAHDLLVGGFPCQDYSVATTQAAGMQGKKGVLWWDIYRILKNKRPGFVLLENVDRLLKSPTAQRGRDFGIMLRCLADVGYRVEWRVVNAADYGAPQKRRRVFIFGAHKKSAIGASMEAAEDRRGWVQRHGFFAKTFPVVKDAVRTLGPEPPAVVLPKDVQRLSDSFGFAFENSGVMVDGKVWTMGTKADTEPRVTLGSILDQEVPGKYFVPEADLPRWKYLKGAKAEKRKAANGHVYHYSEGPIPFPDRLDQPSRTLITSEGGTSPSRFKHLILDPKAQRYRVLTPTECEKLNQFNPGWTDTGMPENWRYFCMGNALVVGLIERMGRELLQRTRPTSQSLSSVPPLRAR